MLKFKNKSSLAQTTLEFTLCFIVLVIIFIAGFLVFEWAMKTMTHRQGNYEVGVVGQDYATPLLNLHIGGQ